MVPVEIYDAIMNESHQNSSTLLEESQEPYHESGKKAKKKQGKPVDLKFKDRNSNLQQFDEKYAATMMEEMKRQLDQKKGLSSNPYFEGTPDKLSRFTQLFDISQTQRAQIISILVTIQKHCKSSDESVLESVFIFDRIMQKVFSTPTVKADLYKLKITPTVLALLIFYMCMKYLDLKYCYFSAYWDLAMLHLPVSQDITMDRAKHFHCEAFILGAMDNSLNQPHAYKFFKRYARAGGVE